MIAQARSARSKAMRDLKLFLPIIYHHHADLVAYREATDDDDDDAVDDTWVYERTD